MFTNRYFLKTHDRDAQTENKIEIANKKEFGRLISVHAAGRLGGNITHRHIASTDFTLLVVIFRLQLITVDLLFERCCWGRLCLFLFQRQYNKKSSNKLEFLLFYGMYVCMYVKFRIRAQMKHEARPAVNSAVIWWFRVPSGRPLYRVKY